MRRLLVTGGAGFIGSNFIRYWLKAHPGDEILNFDKLTYAANLKNLRDIENLPNYRFMQGDIADPKAVEKAMAGVEIVVNFAAESHVDRSILGPADFIATNVVGTHVLLEAARKHGVKKFHHISTDEVFGDAPLDSKIKFSEESPLRPSSPYAASKAGSDHLVRAYHRTYGLPTTTTNATNNYGPYQFPEKFLALMITSALMNEPLPIYGDGRNMRDWLFVEDHCRAIDLVLQKGRSGETYCVAGGEEKANLEVAREILRILGRPESLIKLVPDRPGHDLRYPVSGSKIKRELDFAPAVRFAAGLRETIKWYKENEEWWKKLKERNREYFEKQYAMTDTMTND